MKQKEEQISLFDPGMPFGKMCPVRTVQTAERTSELSSKSSAASSTPEFMFLDLRGGAGSPLVPLWERGFPSHGARWTPNIGESPKDAVECGLSQILEDKVPLKYYLSAKACEGILRRAKRHGVALDPRLEKALERQVKVQDALRMGEGEYLIAGTTKSSLQSATGRQQARDFTTR